MEFCGHKKHMLYINMKWSKNLSGMKNFRTNTLDIIVSNWLV